MSFAALGVAMFANPIGLVVLAISALVGAAVIAFNTNEDFRNSVLGLWDAIQNRLAAPGHQEAEHQPADEGPDDAAQRSPRAFTHV